ncbi:hypothetical protein [Alteriqipengyuania lutimaris]|uniref:Uncharacterized protein n=1 Tax=Alteriqipengyuania lutimaris TaxID=1538146 RepID=A0A395LN81_9SPHN|nr:hypothetical protein [Alteriqipengyuania lutimaris]MBB3033077.1 hypothetical protein [Alteriqipengyuania lutimaris]RDS77857.1 hypothetical protein DL238_09755 [Alteriqipengyuania lutimaris]
MDQADRLEEMNHGERKNLSDSAIEAIGKLLAATSLILQALKGLPPLDPMLARNAGQLKAMLAAFASLELTRRTYRRSQIAAALAAIRQFRMLCRPAQVWAAP